MRSLVLILLVVCTKNLNAQTVDSVAIKQIDSLLKESINLTNQNKFEQALGVNSHAEKLVFEKLTKESVSYGKICHNHGRINFIKGNMPEAEKWDLEAIAIKQKILGKEDPSYATSLNNLGLVYKEMSNYEKAEATFLEVKAIREKTLGKEHIDYGTSLNTLAGLYYVLSKYEQAEPLYLEAKAINEKSQLPKDMNYAGLLINLATLYKFMGKNEKAEPLFIEAKEIFEVKLNNRQHPFYINCLNNMGVMYRDMGNYEKAESLLLEALSIGGNIFGKETPEFAGALINLAEIYNQQSKFEKTKQLLLEAKDIFEVHLKELKHPYYINCLMNLASLYSEMGYFEKAESLYIQVKNLWENILGKENYGYANTLICLGGLYSMEGNYEKAEPNYLEAKAVYTKISGKENRDYVICLENLVKLYEMQGQYSISEPLAIEEADLERNLILKSASFLSENELFKLTTLYQSRGDDLGAYMFARPPKIASNLPGLAFDHALFYKGYLLSAISRVNELAKLNPESTEINNQLKGYRRRLAVEYSRPIAEQKDVALLEEMATSSEKKLANLVTGYAENVRQINWKDVQEALKPGQMAIEFVNYTLFNKQQIKKKKYAVLMLKPGDEVPKFIPLFDESSLDYLLHSKTERKADYVNTLYTLADRGAIAIDGPKKSLYEILWRPLEKELSGIKTIYFSPTGLLHRINLDAIPIANGISETETLADQYNLIELNSTRQLVIPNQVKIINNDAVLFGGIAYEQDSAIQNREPLIASRSRGEISFSSVDSTSRGGSWNYLAGTEREVNSIEKLMLTAKVKVNLKKGYNATEESFKNIGTNNSPSPRILHIATHGYFFPDPKNTSKGANLLDQNEPVFKISDHPMLRSGLIMAGGNASWQGKQTLEGREDGILTAYEISQMNLSNTELVVLSACETGLGDIQGNEGVYGLQRAFKIAGAKYLIMSLWQVPDKQTSLLMTTFYKKWLEAEGPDGVGKMTIPDAFHAAQKELREAGLDPYQWAGFVLVE